MISQPFAHALSLVLVRRAAFLLALTAIFLPASVQAQLPGKVDPAFAPTIRSVGTVNCLITQPDGKQIAGGKFTNAGATSINSVARLNADGSVDTSFVPPTDLGIVYSAALDSGGKVFVLSYKLVDSAYRFALVRLNADGSQDTGFATALFSGEFSSGELRPFVLATQPDGKVLVGGSFVIDPNVGTAANTTVRRYNVDGSQDNAFRLAGNLSANEIDSLLVLPNRQILVAGGFSSFNGNSINGVVRINADGSMDASYPAAGSSASGFDLTLQPDGKVLYLQRNFSTLLLGGLPRRLNADGSPDATFAPQIDATASFVSLRLQTNGKVVVGGAVNSSAASGYAVGQNGLVRLNADGSADPSFQALIPLVDSQFLVLGLQGNGQVLIGGEFQRIAGSPHSSFARLNADGSLDLTFTNDFTDAAGIFAASVGADGLPLVLTAGPIINGLLTSNLVSLNPNGSLHTTYAANLGPQVYYDRSAILNLQPVLAPQPDGKVLVSANFSPYVGSFALKRFNADGSEDSSFAPSYLDSYSLLRAVAPQADGHIYIAGSLNTVFDQPPYPLNRLNADGSFDPAFVTADPGATRDGASSIYALAVQPDGKILAAGGFRPVNSQARSSVLRFQPDGSLDPSFNAGIFAINDNSRYASATALVLQPDGKVVVGGYFTAIGGIAGASVARLNPDGSVDATFNAGSGANLQTVSSLALQADGKIIAGGEFITFNGANRAGVVRLNPDGSVDPQFNPGTGVDSESYARFATLTSDGSVLVGGTFSRFDGQPREGIVRLYGGDIPPAPVLTSPATADGQVGQPFSYQIAATNQPTSLGATGLPAGLTVNAGTGLISGTPTEAGTFTVTLSAGNLGGTGTATLNIVITPDLPVIDLLASVPKITAGTGQKGVVLLTRTGGDLANDVLVNYSVKGTAINGTDYILLKGTKKLKAGKDKVTLKIKPLGAGAGAGNKRVVTLTLLPGDGYTVGESTKQKVKIFGQ